MTPRPPAILALEDGRVFRGESFGALAETCGEVVFNTAMTGYQEVITDPSYCGQIVTFTYPLLGNYGVNAADWESARIHAQAVVCREVTDLPSNWRSEGTLPEMLERHGVPGICGIDTRALTRHLRDRGVMRGCLSATERDPDALVERARKSPSMVGLALADLVTCVEPYEWTDAGPAPWSPDAASEDAHGGAASVTVAGGAPVSGPLVAVLDYGVKYGILRRLRAEGFRVVVMPGRSTAREVLALDPAGVVLSNGPGDPEPLDFAIAAAGGLVGKVPVLGICLGHQLLGLAHGAATGKLKFGHRGVNHPVIDRRTGTIEITSQNHGFRVEPDRLPDELELTHWSCNDGTLEGMVHRTHPMLSCQYHPEASAGPHDARPWFHRFAELVFRPGRARTSHGAPAAVAAPVGSGVAPVSAEAGSATASSATASATKPAPVAPTGAPPRRARRASR